MTSSAPDSGRFGTEDPRQRILRIAASLFAKKGYQAVGVAEIGDAVGLGRGALYYHIGSKEELLYDIVIRYITELVATGSQILRVHTDSHDRITELSRHLMKTIADNVSELTVCFRESEALTGDRRSAVAVTFRLPIAVGEDSRRRVSEG